MSNLRLQGKVALITGAASGIGEEAAKLFAENGASVVIADIQDELGQLVAASIAGNGRKATYFHCDVRHENQVEEAVNFTVQKHGTIDILFSNAGVLGHPASFLDLDLDQLDRTYATNVRGMAAAIKHGARAMVARKVRGSIICNASVAACLGGVGPHEYAASKAAVVGLVRSASAELGAHGIRVNCVSPFGVATPLPCKAYSLEPRQLEASTSAMASLKGVVLKARHIAEAALFFASDESGYITGHNLVVDGGFTVGCHSQQSSAAN